MLQKAEASQARTVRLHLINGTPNGIVRASSNRCAVAFRAPRARLKELCQRDEMNRKGIYVLSGQDPENPLHRKIYIGESDCIHKRVLFQEQKRDFFDRIAIAVGKDDSLSKDHCRFVESELIRLARNSNLVTLVNENDPGFDRLGESDRLEAKDFLDELLFLLPILGFDVFRPLTTFEPGNESAPTFEMNVVGTRAFACETDDGFIVLTDSTARIEATRDFPAAMESLRQKLLDEKKLVADSKSGYYRFTTDVSFTSPSAAATFVAASSANGPLAWKVRGTALTYKDWLEAQIAA